QEPARGGPGGKRIRRCTSARWLLERDAHLLAEKIAHAQFNGLVARAWRTHFRLDTNPVAHAPSSRLTTRCGGSLARSGNSHRTRCRAKRRRQDGFARAIAECDRDGRASRR